MRAAFQRHICKELKDTSYDVDEAGKGSPHRLLVIHQKIYIVFFFMSLYLFSHFQASPQAVVDLLVMREWLCSVPLSFMHDCFSSINISAGRHQQHRQDLKQFLKRLLTM